jgi:16S rRNA (uracil1498-N3)-methyltransferase
MTRRRWIADQVCGDRAVLLGSNADHLARVLRACVGQEFEVSTGPSVRLGRIVQVAGDRVEFQLSDELPQTPPAATTLLLAVFKFDRFEWAIEKATELGVSQILPLIAQRTDAHLAAAAPKRLDRWRRIAREAAQQSRRVAPPEIAQPQPLKSALAITAGLRIVLAETQPGTTLADALQNTSSTQPAEAGRREIGAANSVALAIGPEGGWTSKELSAFTDAGWTAASLGPSILRAETAALAALAIVSALLP